MELDWTTESVDGVTLVSLLLTNERAVDRRVRVRNRLDGPVLPPRRQGEPEAGWDREGFTTVVPAGNTVASGYACPAPEAEPPAAVDEVDPPDATTAGGETGASEESVEDVIRRLGDARPPRAVVGDGVGDEGEQESHTSTIASPDEVAEESGTIHPERSTEPPSHLTTVLAPYRSRIETVEALGLASMAEATAVLEANGGVPGVEQAGHRLDADAAELRAVAAEATALAARAEAATVPTEALRRLA